MSVVYANLGSNLGNRKSLIERAINRIGDIFGYYCVSGYVESDPWGFSSANRFLNIGVAFRSTLHPELILEKLQAIEKEISAVAHRDETGRYKDREIDIDIMDIQGMEYHSATLNVPHPHLSDRPFFLIPYHELKVNQEFEKVSE